MGPGDAALSLMSAAGRRLPADSVSTAVDAFGSCAYTRHFAGMAALL